MNLAAEELRDVKRSNKIITIDSLIQDCQKLLRDTREFDGKYDEKLYGRILDFRDDLIAAILLNRKHVSDSYKPIIEQIHNRYLRKLTQGEEKAT